MPTLLISDTMRGMRRTLIALVAAGLLSLATPAARADGESEARRAMREAAIEKADVVPRPALDSGPGEPRRGPATPAPGNPAAPSPGRGERGPDGSSPPGPPGLLRDGGSARAEAHRLAIEAVRVEAGLRDALPPGQAQALPGARAAESNASATGQAHAAAAAARAAAVRKAGFTPPGLANGNGNGNGNGKGNGKP